MQHEDEKSRPGEKAAHSKSNADGEYDCLYCSRDHLRARELGFTPDEIHAAQRRSERAERRQRRRNASLEWESNRQRDDVLAGLRTLWRMATSDDRPAMERIAERVREGAL